jgi:hypothetical protein
LALAVRHERRDQMRIWNLTPHAISVEFPAGVRFTMPSDGVLRVEQHTEEAEPLDGMPTVTVRMGELAGIPAEVQPGDHLIVSVVAAPALKIVHGDLYKVLTPDTGPTCVRDDQGRIEAVRQLIRWN